MALQYGISQKAADKCAETAGFLRNAKALGMLLREGLGIEAKREALRYMIIWKESGRAADIINDGVDEEGLVEALPAVAISGPLKDLKLVFNALEDAVKATPDSAERLQRAFLKAVGSRGRDVMTVEVENFWLQKGLLKPRRALG